MVARSYQVLAADFKGLIISALITLEARLKVPVFGVFQAVNFDARL